MKTSVISLTLFFAVITMSPIAIAQDVFLKGRSAIDLNLGFWGGAKASNTIGLTGIQSDAGTNGFAGGFGYSYWLREDLSLTVTAGLLSAQASTKVSVFNVTQQSSTVIPCTYKIQNPHKEDFDFIAGERISLYSQHFITS
jgi:hypothetical protein